MEKLSNERLLEETVASMKIEEESADDIPAEEMEGNGDEDTGSKTNTDTNSDSDSDSDSDSEHECDICNKRISGYLPFRQHLKGKKHAKAVLRKKKEKKLKETDTVTEIDDELLIQEPYAKCKVCNKDFFGLESYQQHLKCKKHKQKVLEASILEQVQEEGRVNPDKLRDLCKNKRLADDVFEDSKEELESLNIDDENEKEQEEFECKECEKLFNGLIPFTQHLVSKSHAKKVEKKSLLHKVVPESSKEDEISVKSEKNDVNTLCVEDDVLVCKSCSMSFNGPENALSHIKSKKHAINLDKYLRKLEKRKEKKKSKDVNFSSTTEKESQDKTSKEEHQPTPGGSGIPDILDSSETVKPSTSEGEVNDELTTYKKYKEYKTIMNSLREDEIMQ